MADAPGSALPVQLAIRLLMDSVSYSNALPEWFEPLMINYVGREARVRKAIEQYLSGAQPQKPFDITLPKRDGKSNVWVVPSVNDQIICQACVSAIANTIEQKFIDRTKVFSCRLNRDPNRLAFLEDQVTAWALFQARLKELCATDMCVLQIDLKDAFDSIKLPLFGAFIKRAGVDPTAARLLEVFLKSFSAISPGLPFLNDSFFFLGNAYFSEVDKIVAKQAPNFIRYVDDYKIFDRSRSTLETKFAAIRGELQKIGFEISDNKVWLGAGQDYLQAISTLKYAKTEKTEYVDAAIQPAVFEPEDTVALVKACLEKPEDYLHQGYGRLQMATIRRMRVYGMYSDQKDLASSPAERFGELMSEDLDLIKRTCDLLDEYSSDQAHIWRLVWVLYLCKDVRPQLVVGRNLQARLIGILQRIRQTSKIPRIGRLWASNMPNFPNTNKSRTEIEELHALNYIERGQRLYGA